ncbi:15189_t:CDS:2, partial [Racocetra persica]
QKYIKRMEFTFNEIFSCRIPFDTRLEALSLYSYDDQIKAWEEERKMKDCILFDFYKQKLKSVSTYVNALERTKGFLLQTFEKVYRNLRKSESIQMAKGEYRFHLADVQLNISSLIIRLTKQNIKDFVEGDQESKGRKKTKDTDLKNLSSENDIFTQLEKDGS